MSTASSRARVLANIRSSLNAQDADMASRRKAVEARLRDHPEILVPERGRAQGDSRIELFCRMLEGQSATVTQAKKPEDIPDIVATYLREHNLPAEFRTGNDPLVTGVPWQNNASLTRHSGRGQASDAVALSHARSAAAETGTLFLLSGQDNPTTLNFLPDTHIVLIKRKDILGSYEDAWNVVRAQYGEGNMPRTVNLVSGPSRTADIDQIIVMGAHGPRRLHVIVLE